MNVKYSKIFAGTMTWGSWGKQLTNTQMVDLIQHCYTNNITTFDHADIYGDYGNEQLFGSAFKEAGIARENIQLVSKCGIQMTSGRTNKVKHYQYDAAYIISSAERSLARLQTDYLDLFLLHRPSPLLHPEEVSKAINTLKEQGKIKQFGVSNFNPAQIAVIEKEVKVEANQVEFSLTHLDPIYNGTFDDCLANNRMAMAWSPLGSYYREDTAQNNRIKQVLASLAEKYNADESMLLLAFLIKHPAGVFPVVGTANKERLVNSLNAAAIDLELQDWFLLLEASQGNEVP
ncbi:aldo/keto reductase family oxidoreductase [Croceivirga sp. JEA036]|uniref:aldo/keto reductase n=1 Tax=Croceivirga sp. JEA036 TaxID=2721162 RepID=UPI00293BC4B0|nr:aldo/keto reductase [Croceivirga sp. JEA036]